MAQITQTTNQLTSPAWAGDVMDVEHMIAGGARIDPAQFSDSDAVVVTVGTGGAAGGATSVPVTALPGPLPSGTTLYFGTNKFATLTAAAAAAATTITVAAIPTALVAGDVATYAGTGTKQKTIPSGTPIGRTFAERAAATPFGPAGAADDEVYLVAFEVTDADRNADVELYRPNSIVKENFLPNFAGIASGVLIKIRAAYVTTRGAN